MSAATETIHTSADFESWPANVENWPTHGVALAVVGRPVGHSLSPVIHNAALAELARTDPKFGRWRYVKFDIAPEELPAALAKFHKLRFAGLNLTVPHKQLAVDHLFAGDAFVHAAGAANTLTYTLDGWRGSNTDGFGLSAALRQEFGLELAGAHVILLGAGGAARGAAIECLRQRCATLSIGNRSAASLDTLLTDIGSFSGGTLVRGFALSAPPNDLPSRAVVINATSLGLRDDDPPPIDLAKLSAPAAVYDMIYRPPQTALLRGAAALGLPRANGLSMLVHQGARSLEIWTGSRAPVSVMQAAANAALASA